MMNMNMATMMMSMLIKLNFGAKIASWTCSAAHAGAAAKWRIFHALDKLMQLDFCVDLSSVSFCVYLQMPGGLRKVPAKGRGVVNNPERFKD